METADAENDIYSKTCILTDYKESGVHGLVVGMDLETKYHHKIQEWMESNLTGISPKALKDTPPNMIQAVRKCVLGPVIINITGKANRVIIEFDVCPRTIFCEDMMFWAYFSPNDIDDKKVNKAYQREGTSTHCYSSERKLKRLQVEVKRNAEQLKKEEAKLDLDSFLDSWEPSDEETSDEACYPTFTEILLPFPLPSRNSDWSDIIFFILEDGMPMCGAIILVPLLYFYIYQYLGNKALVLAMHAGWGPICRLLLCLPCMDGHTPLFNAAWNGNGGTVEEFLRLDAVDVNANITLWSTSINETDFLQMTPLMISAAVGHTYVVEKLLEHPNIDVNTGINERERGRITALVMAAEKGNIEIVKKLLDHTAIDAINEALFGAAVRGHGATVEVLLAYPGIDPNVEGDCGDILRGIAADDGSVIIEEPRVSGLCTPLFLAASNGHDQVIKSLVSDPEIDINWKEENSGSTALIEAVGLRHKHAVRHILRHHKVDVNQKDRRGAAALSIAAWQGYPEMVLMLIKHPDIDVNILTDGYTPLILAAARGHESIMKLLRRHPDTHIF